MNVGSRLRELRLARGMSQGDIEKRTGLLRCYISRVEGGHTVPNLETLNKFAEALGIEFYQLFFTGEGNPTTPSPEPVQVPKAPERRPVPGERDLLKAFEELSKADRRLLLFVARKMVAMGKRT